MAFRWRPIENIALFVCAIALIISMKQCRENAANYAGSKDYLASLNDTITYLKNGIAQKPAVVVSHDMLDQILAENTQLKKALKDAKLKAKNVQTITQVVNKMVIDTIAIAFHDTLPCAEFAPVAFGIDSTYYTIAGVVKKTGIVLTTVNFPDSITIITATKPHLFRKDEFLVSVGHSNPLIKTAGSMNLTVSEKRKLWRSGWYRVGFGLATGIYISQKFLK